MDTNEKNIKKLADKIVISLMKLSLGEKTGLFTCSVMKSLMKHKNFSEIKALVINHLDCFNEELSSPEDWKKLADFRFKLLALYEDK